MDAGTLLDPEWAGGTLTECGYRATLKATAADAWESVRRTGRKTGWYHSDYLWRLCGIGHQVTYLKLDNRQNHQTITGEDGN